MTRTAVIALRIGAVVLVVLVVAVVAVNVYRDRIALEIANSALSATGVTVRDASIASLGADEVRFSHILLVLDGGTLIRIEDIILPVTFRGFAGSELRAGRVTVMPDDSDEGPLPLASMLRSWLDAPSVVPDALVSVGEVELPGVPTIRDLVWNPDPAHAGLAATIGPYSLRVESAPGAETAYGVSSSLFFRDASVLNADAAIGLGEHGSVEINGVFTMQLAPLVPVLDAAGVLPAGIVDPSGRVAASFTTLVSGDPGDPVELRMEVRLEDGPRFGYRPDDGSPETAVDITGSSPIDASVVYPATSWSAAAGRAELHIADERFGDLPVTLESASCRSGVVCRTAVAARIPALSAGEFTAGGIGIEARTLHFSTTDGRWEARTDDLVLTVSEPAWSGRKLPAPSFRGAAQASNDSVSATLQVSIPGGGLGGRLGTDASFEDGSGSLRVENGELLFDRLPPSRLLADWPYVWDLHGGTARVDGALQWRRGSSDVSYTGSFAVGADGVAGSYADVAFLGLSTTFDATLDRDTGPAISPLTIGVDLIDVGFPIEGVQLSADPDLDDLAADVTALSMSALGGSVSAEPFRYVLGAARNSIVLQLDGIQLPLIVGLADLEAVEVSGRVSGTLPVTIAGGSIGIEGGRLRNEPPGGVIRYRAGTPVGDGQSQLGTVMRTLRNFEFDTLSSEVSYTDAGDLKLQMRLAGVNPDVDATQPVILNLGIEDNIPQLLRSLQAARSIEDILEKRYSR